MINKLGRKIILWSARTNLLRVPRRLTKRAFFDAIYAKKGNFVFIKEMFDLRATFNPEILEIDRLVKQIKGETRMLLREAEALQIFNSIKQTAKIDGDIAEVGVFKGGSAKLICEAKENKSLHLFDTFEGLPAPTLKDSTNQYRENQYAAQYDEVKNYLQNYPDVYFYKGLFPATAGPIADKMFSFVHFDVDLYETTLECIRFFYPRMSKGGIMISHDYGYAIGVRRAFDEFFSDKPEPIIELELIGTQCLIVKT